MMTSTVMLFTMDRMKAEEANGDHGMRSRRQRQSLARRLPINSQGMTRTLLCSTFFKLCRWDENLDHKDRRAAAAPHSQRCSRLPDVETVATCS